MAVDESCADPEKHWETVLSYQTPNGQSRFPNMVKVIRCVKRAETERSFSAIANIVTKHRSLLSVEVLNGLMTIKKKHIKCAHNMEIDDFFFWQRGVKLTIAILNE